MPLNVRVDGDVVILSNFGRLLNDPRYVDAGREVDELLGRGYRKFVLELAGVHELSPVALGLFTTLTRRIRRDGGEAVLARLSRDLKREIEEMKLDAFWDLFPSVRDATDALGGSSP